MSFRAEVALEVRGLSKGFLNLNSGRRRLSALRSAILQSDDPRVSSDDTFWALKDINFVLNKGQALGVLGQNGSGKSTLLQIIAGTMSPTSGVARHQGRLAAILELGTGFNPEFTGLENVALGCKVLGLADRELEDKLDSILAFADIGQYIQQPVRTYSSGMLVRLAFAIQTAIEPDILIIDEALAVGDAKFQLKCFKRLRNLRDNGTTVLFVSHSIDQVKEFCESGLFLERGHQRFFGEARRACVQYLNSIFPNEELAKSRLDSGTSGLLATSQTNSIGRESPSDNAHVETFGVGGARVTRLAVIGQESALCPRLSPGEVEFQVDFEWDIDHVIGLIERDGYEDNLSVGIAVSDKRGVYLFGGNGLDAKFPIVASRVGKESLRFKFDFPTFSPGDYFVTVAIALGVESHHVQLKWYDALLQFRFEQEEKKVYGVLGVNYVVRRAEQAGLQQ